MDGSSSEKEFLEKRNRRPIEKKRKRVFNTDSSNEEKNDDKKPMKKNTIETISGENHPKRKKRKRKNANGYADLNTQVDMSREILDIHEELPTTSTSKHHLPGHRVTISEDPNRKHSFEDAGNERDIENENLNGERRHFQHVSSLEILRNKTFQFSLKSQNINIDTTDEENEKKIVKKNVRFSKERQFIEDPGSDNTSSKDTDEEVSSARRDSKKKLLHLHPKKYPYQSYSEAEHSSSDESNLGKRKSNWVLRGIRSSLSTNLNKAVVFIYMVIPPDGGYGWIIVLMSFLCQVIVDGIIFSLGILLPKISEDFGIPMGYIVIIGSVQIGCYFLSGALASALINAYGFRSVAIAGCIIAGVSEVIASFSVNMSMMLVFYSVIGAPGLSMIWVASQLIIGYYFERLRPIANGVSCSGAGIGILVFCFLNSWLLPIIGWRNVMRVHFGCLIVALLLSLSFIQVRPTRVGKIITEEIYSDSSHERASLYIDGYKYASITSIEIDIPQKEHVTPYEEPRKRKRSILCRKKQRSVESFHLQPNEQRVVVKPDPIEKQDLFYTGPPTYPEEQHRLTQLGSITSKSDVTRTKSINYNISLMSVKRPSKTASLKKAGPSSTKFKFKNCIPYKVRRALKLLFDFNLLKVYEFKILMLSAFLFPMGLNIPFVYSKLRTGIDASTAAFITPTIGASNFVFRILSGYIAFKYRGVTSFLCGFGMFFGGVVVFISAFYGANVVWFQFFYGACYGVAPAFYSTLRAIIYVRSLGLEKLTTCFGLTALAMGTGVFMGTTTGGLLTQFTGSFTSAFAFSGLCIIISGLLKMILPILIRRRAVSGHNV